MSNYFELDIFIRHNYSLVFDSLKVMKNEMGLWINGSMWISDKQRGGVQPHV